MIPADLAAIGPVTLTDLDQQLDAEDHPSFAAAHARTRHPLWLRRHWAITTHCGRHTIRRSA
ncbi:hypothetical protein [Gordonia iterans]